MSAVDTGHMVSFARTDICVASTHYVEVSEVSTVPLFKSQLSQYHNVEVSGRRSGLKSAKMARNGSRMVARS